MLVLRLVQMNHTVAEIEALIADTQSDIALQPEVDNAAEARLQREKKEHDELHALVATQSAKKAKYDRMHETAKVGKKPCIAHISQRLNSIITAERIRTRLGHPGEHGIGKVRRCSQQ
jgi:hypothetical protein